MPSLYRTDLSTYVLFTAMNALPFCPTGSPVSGNGVYSVAVAITPGSPPTAKVAWCSAADFPQFIVTTSDGTHDAIAWLNSGGTLAGLLADTGQLRIAVSDLICPSLGTTSPIAVKGRIVEAGIGRLCSYSLH